uniref:Secreted peptide n=1 Tax=Rhipicephalus pulchellus TaxID=72859 RepID=L7MC58_RHIPC
MGFHKTVGLIACAIVFAVIADIAYGQKGGAGGEPTPAAKPTKLPKLAGPTKPAKSTKPTKKSPVPASTFSPIKTTQRGALPPRIVPRSNPATFMPRPPLLPTLPELQMPKGPWKGTNIVYPPVDRRLAPTRAKWDTW